MAFSFSFCSCCLVHMVADSVSTMFHPQRQIANIGSKSVVLEPSMPIHGMLFRQVSPKEALAPVLTEKNLSIFAFDTGSAKRSSAIKIVVPCSKQLMPSYSTVNDNQI